MSRDWSWFTGIVKEDERKQIDIDYEALAKDRKKAIQAITKEPELLFKVVRVDKELVAWGCDAGDKEEDYEYVDVKFIDLLIENKTIRESDIVDISGIDWYKVSEILPLSMKTLERYNEKVNWDAISISSFYEKDERFIRKFHKRINWSLCSRLKINTEEGIGLVFNEGIVPLGNCMLTVPRSEIDAYLSNLTEKSKHITSSEKNMTTFMNIFGAEKTETLFGKLLDSNVMVNPSVFAEVCCSWRYVPKTEMFIEVLRKRYCDGDWLDFILSCKPNIQFIEEHILPCASACTWKVISEMELPSEFIEKYKQKLNIRSMIQKNKFDTEVLKKVLGKTWNAENVSRYVRLTPEFIDEFADKLDWYYVCEHQELPGWLMEKHRDKLNWGQVSLYQKMSDDFIASNWNMLNEVKLAMNKKLHIKGV